MKFLQYFSVERLFAKVLLQYFINAALEENAVVEGNQADVVLLVPAGLPSASLGAVHDVVGDQEEGLELNKDMTIYLADEQ